MKMDNIPEKVCIYFDCKETNQVVVSFSVDVFIHHTGQYFSPDSRARVDVSPRRYKKIAINHEVRRKCSSLKIYILCSDCPSSPRDRNLQRQSRSRGDF